MSVFSVIKRFGIRPDVWRAKSPRGGFDGSKDERPAKEIMTAVAEEVDAQFLWIDTDRVSFCIEEKHRIVFTSVQGKRLLPEDVFLTVTLPVNPAGTTQVFLFRYDRASRRWQWVSNGKAMKRHLVDEEKQGQAMVGFYSQDHAELVRTLDRFLTGTMKF